MARSVHFHPLARTDLLDIYAYIESRSGPERAGDFIDRVERLCRNLAVSKPKTSTAAAPPAPAGPGAVAAIRSGRAPCRSPGRRTPS
ncbi:type II toxin-antitoxin system RelE/ParE family toxin [Methylobacterium sp. J-026]|uniref:type II toxin-antitoxin system RelE/ParE family toxin n=1 Tax=Methylobacterium sp. J-026 TaxID=2836624 RepID=UPI00391D5E70